MLFVSLFYSLGKGGDKFLVGSTWRATRTASSTVIRNRLLLIRQVIAAPGFDPGEGPLELPRIHPTTDGHADPGVA